MTVPGVAVDVGHFKQAWSQELESVEKWRTTANYLSGAMLYLKDNFLLRDKFERGQIKDRLLGHWGTDPGLNLIWAHCNLLLRHHNHDMFIVIGPGHGAPAVLANLWLEKSLEAYYPSCTQDYDGLSKLVKGFCWPGGFGSHASARLPGMIHEGGELGYALAVSFGAVMDNPDLIVTCVVGDGEAETGPTATAWHSYKYLDPRESGAVLPIVHVNGYKISCSTVYGQMSDDELFHLFTGYGYQVRFVQDMQQIDADMAASMEWAYNEIRRIQHEARAPGEGRQPPHRARWPIILLRTPKGWTGPKVLHGKQIEGSFRSHGIPIPDPKKDDESFNVLSDWLHSYRPSELFHLDSGAPRFELLEKAMPPVDRRMGVNKHAMGRYTRALQLPELKSLAVEADRHRDILTSPTRVVGEYLAEIIKRNPSSFRIFSPDELESNRLGAIFKVTHRNFQWQDDQANKGGRVIEMLSEHNCEGWLQGYALTGRWGLFPSYETFLGIVATMIIQYEKFLKKSADTPQLERKVPAITLMESSTLWRQEHNGYSHQDPMLINNLINLKGKLVSILLPPDANSLLCAMERSFQSYNKINLVVATKNAHPSMLNYEQAREHVTAGAGIWPWLSTDEGRNPDVVLVGIGNETNYEVVAACRLLKRDLPQLRVRMVNLVDLLMLDAARVAQGQRAFTEEEFAALFTEDKPLVFNFHGYPSAIWQLLHGRKRSLLNIVVNGFAEEGATTTPFKMLTLNHCSRYHVAINAIRVSMAGSQEVALHGTSVMAKYEKALQDHDRYIVEHGSDPEHLL